MLDGIEAADATLFRHDGLFWMTSAVREGVGGYSDSLAIHYASDLLGPWQEHAQRPVLIDAAMARPPAPWCAATARSGARSRIAPRAMAMRSALRASTGWTASISRSPFRPACLPGPLWPGGRIHTLNRCGRLECIDGTLRNPRIGALRPYAAARMTPRGSDQNLEPVALP